MWATDNMGGRVKYLDGNRYTQVLSNGTYFADIYPMAKKDDSGKAIRMFVMELDVPEELTADVSKD